MSGNDLFGEGDSEEENIDFDISVDRDYEQAYTDRKRREQLSRLKERGIDLSDVEEEDSSSEVEDDDALLLSKNIQKEFLTLVPLLRKRDPSIYQHKSDFFSAPPIIPGLREEEKEEEEEKKEKEKKGGEEGEKKKKIYTFSDMLRDNAVKEVE
eukprot:CAMPEP_0201488334 /NCGR_PEP_ID=MMETSP0151_2-20130828/17899_1 /ASSEMBLY_ACC=CAM_ASM_000257 /TAXON_ID=200890 /ORGANISM="Paramoeba atlantica, Strain 621/1 / CCAP 1560/9" /LENGTH=153 /DNA_ID=CAMNT_0047873599 /DNA_START=66 /DNA_END=524 /DNA_ORIENTATION=-